MLVCSLAELGVNNPGFCERHGTSPRTFLALPCGQLYCFTFLLCGSPSLPVFPPAPHVASRALPEEDACLSWPALHFLIVSFVASPLPSTVLGITVFTKLYITGSFPQFKK